VVSSRGSGLPAQTKRRGGCRRAIISAASPADVDRRANSLPGQDVHPGVKSAELGSGAGYLGRADAFCVSTLSSMRALWPILPSETNYGRLRPRPKENCPLRMRWASSMPAIVMAAIAAKQKVDGLAVFVDCPIRVMPLPPLSRYTSHPPQGHRIDYRILFARGAEGRSHQNHNSTVNIATATAARSSGRAFLRYKNSFW
jgi:hypothetical protein